jgi:hypothetical protein
MVKIGKAVKIMKEIDVADIAERLTKIHTPNDLEEVVTLVNEKFNGRQFPIEKLASEVMIMVAELIGETRAQDRKFTVDLIQSVVDEIQKNA